MKEQYKLFVDIMDVFGFCIIVDWVDICYWVLGVVYNYFILIFGCFKDYVVIFKVNGYQLLYMILKVYFGIFFEIQICIEEMEVMVNNGIVVYWLYKFYDEFGLFIYMWVQFWMQWLLEIQ